jgi:hypothetical protein
VEATEPMSVDQVIEALVQPEESTEEVVEETESLSDEEITDEVEEEQPEEDSDDDAEEVDESADDAEDDSEEDDFEAEDNEDEVDESEDEDPSSELYTVKVDGVEQKVTLDDLKQGYSGQKYVQKGMQEAAEQKKKAEEVYTTLLQERQALANLVNEVQQGALTPPTEPDLDLAQVDPLGYVEAKAAYDVKLKEYNQKMAKVQQQMQNQSEAELRARQAYANQQAEYLKEQIPELRDTAKAGAFMESIYKAAEGYGYSREEVANITSARDMLVIRDAMRYRRLQEKGQIVREKSKKARKPIKAGAKKTVTKRDVIQKRHDKLRKSGSDEDALALMLNPDLR